MVLVDEPGISAMDAVHKSDYLTRNKLGEVFSFKLSFLPWFLLSLIPVVGWLVGLLFVLPYYKTALATYYYSLKDAAIREADRKAHFKYPGGTPTHKKAPTPAPAPDYAQQQAYMQQQAYAQQQAYLQQQVYTQQPTPPEQK